MSTRTLSIDAFALLLGQAHRKAREASLPFHEAYTDADAAQRSDLRQRWLVNHIMGSLACDRKMADRILSQARTERSDKAQKAYAKASADFSYHVIRPEPSTKPQTSNRISRAHREAAMAYLALFEDTKSALAVLRAVAK